MKTTTDDLILALPTDLIADLRAEIAALKAENDRLQGELSDLYELTDNLAVGTCMDNPKLLRAMLLGQFDPEWGDPHDFDPEYKDI
jgi:hypothetical protein